MRKIAKPYKRRIKCKLDTNKFARCGECLFKNETEYGIVCNLPNRFWNSDLEVIVTIKKQYYEK